MMLTCDKAADDEGQDEHFQHAHEQVARKGDQHDGLVAQMGLAQHEAHHHAHHHAQKGQYEQAVLLDVGHGRVERLDEPLVRVPVYERLLLLLVQHVRIHSCVMLLCHLSNSENFQAI